MAEPPAADVYLSYSQDDVELVGVLEGVLRVAGLEVWAALSRIAAEGDWEKQLASALAAARSVTVCVGATGLTNQQLVEVEAAAARAEGEPDFRLAAVLLPG